MKKNKLNKMIISSMVLGILIIPSHIRALQKEETVYSTLNKDGSLFKTTVVTHLYDANSNEIEDVTKLKNILNINGDEKFTINEDKIKFNNHGNEIFYQGNIEKELPIETSLKYYLNEKEIAEDKLIGKEGKIKIVISFKNTDKHEVYINGNNETLYTPFVVTLGGIIKNKNDSNITISNGKIISTGSKYFIVGISSPGLYESLNIDEFKNMDKIVISYDTASYKPNTFYMVATPKLIDTSDFKVFNKLDNIYNDVDKLQSNMNIIENGAKELEDGAKKLANGSTEISNNLLTISNYMKELENGTLELDNGLKQILEALNNANGELNNGNNENSIKSLYELKNANNEAISTLTNTNTEISQVFNANGIDINSISIEMLPENLKTYKQTYDGNNKLIYLFNLNNTSIDTTINTSISTSSTITNLINQLQETLIAIENGSNKLYSSTNQIRLGIEKLYNGSLILNNGIDSLASGTTELQSGISTYNKEGINKLSNYTNYAKTYTNKLKELYKLTDNYKGFGANNSDTTTFVSVIK